MANMADTGGRLEGKVVLVVGAGQTPGDTIGNGRAAALLFAREGAEVMLVDRDAGAARETAVMVADEGGTADVVAADVRIEDDCRAAVAACIERFGRVDVLHNNVGIGTDDRRIQDLDEEAWNTILDVNLGGMFRMCKHALGPMREQRSGVILNISSIASICATPLAAYKVSKAGVNALTQQLAIANARHGVRVNAILPGLMNTPMAIEGIARARGIAKEDLIRERDASVPLGQKMGTAWDVAHAALFLASDEARFITGVLLPVDGGQSARVG